MSMQSCNSSTWETEAGEPRDRCQPRLHSEIMSQKDYNNIYSTMRNNITVRQ
jgi:hypothetical protein